MPGQGVGRRRDERPGTPMPPGPIGVNERRQRAIMVVPPGMKLNSQESVSMMLIAATSVTPLQFEAAVKAMREIGAGAGRDGYGYRRAGDERAMLSAALHVLGFQVHREGA